MNILIGNKDRFGIEVIIKNQCGNSCYQGYARVWFGGKSIGTIEDYIYLNAYLVSQLTKMIDAPFYDDTIFSTTYSKYKYFIKQIKDDCDNEFFKLVNFGTMSDDFFIVAYRNTDELIILWKLVNKKADVLFSDLKGYDNKVHEYRMAHKEFSDCVSIVNKILSVEGLV
jgi:hypothetical protein